MSNVVVISGKISDYGPKLRPLPSGKWELSFTLCCEEPGRDGQTFTLYVPILVYGAQCEALAETLEPRDLVLVTGKLGWTKKTTKDGEKSGLAVTTFAVEVLVQANTMTTSQGGMPNSTDEDAAVPTASPEPVPVRKARKTSRTRASMLAWSPGASN